MDKDIKITKGIKLSTMSITHMSLMSNNTAFCSQFLKKPSMAVFSDNPEQNDIGNHLIYDISKKATLDQEILQSIIDLLLQLRASQNDQNVFVQNNTVVRQQILNQLKNELLNVRNHLSPGQVQKLEVISSSSFDEKTLNDLLRSLLEDSKKKSESETSTQKGSLIRSAQDNEGITAKVSRTYTKLTNVEKRYRDITSTVSDGEILERSIQEKRLINVIKPSGTPDLQVASPNEKLLNITKNIEEIHNLTKQANETIRRSENVKRVYAEKSLLSKQTDAVKNTVTETEFHRHLYSRDFNYLVEKNVKDRYEKLVESSENKTLSVRKVKELNLVNRREITQNLTDETKLLSEVSDVENRVSVLNKRVNKSIRQNRELRENIISKDSLSRNITGVYNRHISKENQKDDIKRIISRANITTHSVNKYNNIIENQSKIKNIDKIVSKVNDRYIKKNTFISEKDVQNINRTQSQIKNDIVNKYNIKNIAFSDEVSTTKSVNKINLINENLQNNIKFQEIGNQIDKINKNIEKSAPLNKIHNKVLREFNTLEHIKKIHGIYNEIQFRHNKSVSQEYEKHIQNRFLDTDRIFKKELSINKETENKENLVEEINRITQKNLKTVNFRNIVNKVENIDVQDKLFNKINTDEIITNNKNISSNLVSSYLKRLNITNNVNEQHISHQNNTYKETVNRIFKRDTASRIIPDEEHIQEIINQNIERQKNILVKKPPAINRKYIQFNVKQTLSEIVNKNLQPLKTKHIKKFFTDQNKILDVKHITENLELPPLIVRENIKNIGDIENIITRKLSSTPTPKINSLDRYTFGQKNIYREIQDIPRTYFNNITDNLQEKILLQRHHNISPENIYRDIQRSSVIYKNPISLKELEDKIDKSSVEKKPPQKVPVKRPNIQREQIPQVQRPFPVETQPKGKMLQEKDVIRMIESYMQGLDIDTISDVVMDRVEEEILSQKRRSGLV